MLVLCFYKNNSKIISGIKLRIIRIPLGRENVFQKKKPDMLKNFNLLALVFHFIFTFFVELFVFFRAQRNKNKMNIYGNIFIVEGALKLLLSFPLDIDVNDILNYRKNYLLCKCHKKAIANEWDCRSTCILFPVFRKTEINCKSR